MTNERKRAEEVAKEITKPFDCDAETIEEAQTQAQEVMKNRIVKALLQFSKEESEKVLSDSIEGWVYQDDLDGDIIITVNVGKESKSPFKLKTIPVRIVYDKSLVR